MILLEFRGEDNHAKKEPVYDFIDPTRDEESRT
jgi:hypothetical protein